MRSYTVKKMKNFKISVGVDVDDVLLPCVCHAVELANADYGFSPPLSVEEITTWEANGGRSDVIFSYFDREDFFQTQEPFEGACEFIRKLSQMAEVFFVTAISPPFMGIRAGQLAKYFPDVSLKNYIPATRKDIINVDVLLDDGGHNILAANAKYPVLLRRPWNRHITGMLAVNSYDEFLNLLDCIKKSYLEEAITCSEPTVFALVGPSGSGKTAIMQGVIEASAQMGDLRFLKPCSYTTRPRRSQEPEDAYHFITPEQFEARKAENRFLETTMYAGFAYGTSKDEILRILESGSHAILPLDMCGAMAMKMHFPHAVTIFVKRPRKDLLASIIKRDSSDDDKINRLLSLENELKNKDLCDITLENNKTLEDGIRNFLSMFSCQSEP